MTLPGGQAGLVHGMGTEPAEPDWPPLTQREVAEVLARYPAGAGGSDAAPAICWHSPRPFSAAALVRRGRQALFVKRHDPRVRTAADLATEHAFAAHLRAAGVPVPAVCRTSAGRTTVETGGSVYEVHRVAAGVDAYRDALSWSPFTGAGHARAAGAALARLHLAAAGFSAPARPPGVLVNSTAVVTAADPLAAVAGIAAARDGLARYLANRPWRRDLARHVLPAITRARPALAALPAQWGHGDWHPSNLTWTSASPGAQVAGIVDLGLANRTCAVHDLALALERSTIDWLGLAGPGRAGVDRVAVNMLLDGYESVRRLTPAEAAALPDVLPVVHVEYALSEVEYFADVVRSGANADLAYRSYLLGHSHWFAGPDGAAMLDLLRQRGRP